MTNVGILIFVEHVARELDVACAIKYLIEKKHDINVGITPLMYHQSLALKRYKPDVVALPYCRRFSSVTIPQIAKAWPHVTYVNMAWEQLFRSHQIDSKAPLDEFARLGVLHHAWGDFNRDFLVEHGVKQENIFVNSNLSFALYSPPYSRFFASRSELAERYGLDPLKNWVFVPENYSMVFGKDKSVTSPKPNSRPPTEGQKNEADLGRKFATTSLSQAGVWWWHAARLDDVEVIVRPRPVTSEKLFTKTLKSMVGEFPRRLKIIKEGTVREWIMASDVVVSSYSTSLIEAAIAHKPIVMLAPEPFPEYLHSDWYELVPTATTLDEFLAMIDDDESNHTWAPLASWAEKEMMSCGDPISNLADYLAAVQQHKTTVPRYTNLRDGEPKTRKLDMFRSALRIGKQTLEGAVHVKIRRNTLNHDQDVFWESDVLRRVEAWRAILK